MTKILALGNCRVYLNRYGERRPKCNFTCERETCNGRTMHQHGSYARTPVFKHRRVSLPIYRWHCPRCGQTLTVLPDFLVPGGHFATQVREAAMRRIKRGESRKKVAKGVASVAVGSVSPDTIKRWWRQHLEKVGAITQWIAGELIRSGIKEDLLRLHFKGVNLTPLDTANWLPDLLARFLPRPHQDPPLQGYFCALNVRLPAGMWI